MYDEGQFLLHSSYRRSISISRSRLRRAPLCINVSLLAGYIVALQVETRCCAYYHVCYQLVPQQNTILQVEETCCVKWTRVLLSATNFSFDARITFEATTCLTTNLNSALMIGCREARQRSQKESMADGKDEPEFEVDQKISEVINLPCTKTSRDIIVVGAPRLSLQNKRQKRRKAWNSCCRNTTFRQAIFYNNNIL